jgi:hypothetical protein
MPKPKIVDIDALLDESGNVLPKGHDICSVGPSDSSDTGADMVGVRGLDSTSDRNGTGERGSVENDADLEADSDIAADGIVEAEEVGLGGGLDQAEEAQLGVTDEEIEDAVRESLGLEKR